MNKQIFALVAIIFFSIQSSFGQNGRNFLQNGEKAMVTAIWSGADSSLKIYILNLNWHITYEEKKSLYPNSDVSSDQSAREHKKMYGNSSNPGSVRESFEINVSNVTNINGIFERVNTAYSTKTNNWYYKMVNRFLPEKKATYTCYIDKMKTGGVRIETYYLWGANDKNWQVGFAMLTRSGNIDNDDLEEKVPDHRYLITSTEQGLISKVSSGYNLLTEDE